MLAFGRKIGTEYLGQNSKAWGHGPGHGNKAVSILRTAGKEHSKDSGRVSNSKDSDVLDVLYPKDAGGLRNWGKE